MSLMQVLARCHRQKPSHTFPVSTGATSGTSAATGGNIIPPNNAPGGRATNQNASRAGVAAKLANLLPSANPALRAMSGGVYVGDGLPRVPAKLAAKIYRGESIDMGELLPEFWSGLRDEDAEAMREAKVRRSHKETDIFTWLQCFGSFVSVRAQQAPALIPELMAYIATIV